MVSAYYKLFKIHTKIQPSAIPAAIARTICPRIFINSFIIALVLL